MDGVNRQELGVAVPYPQPGPQAHYLSAKFCPEIFYGGARGGGKTAGSLLDFLQDIHIGKPWKGILFRRTFPELEEVIVQAKEFFGPTGAIYHETKKTFQFPTGATYKLRALEKPRDAEKYQGHQYTHITWEELGNWPDLRAYDMLKACLRSPFDVPFKRIRATGNPGGVGHYEIKKRFVDPCPTGYKLISDEKGERMFIPAKVTDNQILLENDPEYIDRLKAVGSPQLVRAWLEGDFSAIEGSFFPEFGIKHILEPFKVPNHWHRIRAYDHGYASPFAVLWGAVSSGKDDEGVQHRCRKGSIVIYREWYGSSEGNEGQRLDPREIAKGIREREEEQIDQYVSDPAIFKTEGGPSIAEEFYNHGIKWTRADNQRLPGWLQIRLRLKAQKLPMIYFFSTCTNVIEQLPLQQHCQRNPEDLDTTGEDHLADTLRYLCMARQLESQYKKPEKALDFKEVPIKELIAGHRRTKRKKL